MKDAFDQIREDLDLLRTSQRRPGMFGEEAHGYRLNAPLAPGEVALYEKRHGIALPASYRDFLLKVGNGGAGPSYGLFRLGEMDGTATDFEPWTSDFIGKLAEPWPHTSIWNDLSDHPGEDADGEELEAFDAFYWQTSFVNGAFPICHTGCALREWLVVTGPERGNVWYDARADLNGLHPLNDAFGHRLTFFQWYRQWLDEALVKRKEISGEDRIRR